MLAKLNTLIPEVERLLKLLEPLADVQSPVPEMDTVILPGEQGEIKTWIPTEEETKEEFIARSGMDDEAYKNWVSEIKPKLTKHFPQVAKFT